MSRKEVPRAGSYFCGRAHPGGMADHSKDPKGGGPVKTLVATMIGLVVAISANVATAYVIEVRTTVR